MWYVCESDESDQCEHYKKSIDYKQITSIA